MCDIKNSPVDNCLPYGYELVAGFLYLLTFNNAFNLSLIVFIKAPVLFNSSKSINGINKNAWDDIDDFVTFSIWVTIEPYILLKLMLFPPYRFSGQDKIFSLITYIFKKICIMFSSLVIAKFTTRHKNTS